MMLLKKGDRIRSGKVEGTFMGVQLKTQDLIVKDDAGNIHFFLQTMTERVQIVPKKRKKRKTG
jgi:hypothetical protein